jgi:hypothetical protein
MPPEDIGGGTSIANSGAIMDFSPFMNESEALTLGALNIENREDHIAIFGTLAITRDRSGLAAAKALRDLCNKIVQTLEGDPGLPQSEAPADAPLKVKNPFARA